MHNSWKSGFFAAIGVTFALIMSSGDALAGVTSVAGKSVVSPPGAIEAVHYSRYPHRHYVRYTHHRRPLHRRHALRYYRYGYDPAAAVVTSAAAGLIVAGAYAPSYAYPYDYSYSYPYPYYSGYGWGGGPVVYGGGWDYRPRYGGGWGYRPHYIGGFGGGGFHRVGGFGGGFHHGGFGGGFHHGGFGGGGFHGGGFHHR